MRGEGEFSRIFDSRDEIWGKLFLGQFFLLPEKNWVRFFLSSSSAELNKENLLGTSASAAACRIDTAKLFHS
jgi:hypothetical protein